MNGHAAGAPASPSITSAVAASSSPAALGGAPAASLGWRAIFKWYWPTSADDGAASERTLLQEHGNVDFSSPQHVQSTRVYLASPSSSSSPLSSPSSSQSAPPRECNERFINTLILDGDNATVPANDRLNVVICHGFGAGLGFFFQNLSPLARIPNARIYAIDLLGMGRSGRPPFPKFQNSVTQDARQAIDFFLDSMEEWRAKQAGLERFVLVGHSMGGYLSALYALRHPERVKRLILASPVGLPQRPDDNQGVAITGHKMPGWLSHMWNANYTPQGLMRALGPMGPKFAMGYINNRFPFLPEGQRRALGSYFYHISADLGSGEYALAALLAPGAWAREPLHTHLAKIRMPTTFVYGQHDWMDRRHAEAAAAHMTVPVEIISVEGAGHHLNMDNPDTFNRILAEQITRE